MSISLSSYFPILGRISMYIQSKVGLFSLSSLKKTHTHIKISSKPHTQTIHAHQKQHTHIKHTHIKRTTKLKKTGRKVHSIRNHSTTTSFSCHPTLNMYFYVFCPTGCVWCDNNTTRQRLVCWCVYIISHNFSTLFYVYILFLLNTVERIIS